MLFLPQSVYDARAALWRDFEAGKTTADETYRKMLELDPDDYIGMLGLGRLRREAGDVAGAEEYFWRAVETQPGISPPYLELAQILGRQPESAALGEALAELAISKRALDDDTLLEGMDFQKAGLSGKALKEFRKLPAATQCRLLILGLREKRNIEPAAVTERLRLLRLLHQIQEDGDLDTETVDAIIGEGKSIVPLLIGVMRGWAQDLLGDSGDAAVENALALLGETGSPAEISYLLEFVDLTHEDASGAASWALGRIIERHPEEAARFIGSIAAGLGPAQRLAIAEEMLRHPELDPAGKLLKQLSEDIEPWEQTDCDAFFPMLLGAMAAARGMEGVKLGRAALLRHGALLSRNARRECEGLLAAFEEERISRVSMPPSPVTVYEICAGEAIWGDEEEEEKEDDEDDEEEEEEEFPPLTEPARRKVIPGRNDPCWCNSGRKYKKCHLDSDEREARAASGGQPIASRGSNEFESLRKRIGEFLGQALTEREIKQALEEYFGDQVQDDADANVAVTDWMLHDWVAPRLGRTVMQEFLVRNGSRITEREREMVEAWSRSVVGLYEVQELTAGVGLSLKDLISGETLFAHDVSMSTRLARWDGLLARVVPGERGTELAGIGLTVPRHCIEPFRLWMEEDRGKAGVDWPEYLKRNWPRIRRVSFEIAASRMESLRLSNTDGEELLFSKAVYRVIDEAAATEALRNCPEFHAEYSQEEAREYFVWLNERQTVMGSIRIGRDELGLECNSRQRMERGKLLLSNIAGESLRHLRDEFTTQKELRNRAIKGHRGVKESEGKIPGEELDAAMGRFLEDHYRDWPDTKLPALGGKTPREAVRTAKGRKQVIAVLKDVENGEDRKRQAGEPFYDVARLRAELGLA